MRCRFLHPSQRATIRGSSAAHKGAPSSDSVCREAGPLASAARAASWESVIGNGPSSRKAVNFLRLRRGVRMLPHDDPLDDKRPARSRATRRPVPRPFQTPELFRGSAVGHRTRKPRFQPKRNKPPDGERDALLAYLHSQLSPARNDRSQALCDALEARSLCRVMPRRRRFASGARMLNEDSLRQSGRGRLVRESVAARTRFPPH